MYATNSGGAHEAAALVRDTLASASYTVELKRASHVVPTELGGYDLLVLLGRLGGGYVP